MEDISRVGGYYLLLRPGTVHRAARLQSLEEGARVTVSGVKVFSATKAKEREGLGDQVTTWIRANPDAEIIDKIVTQSSDSEFHCLTITLFYRRNKKGAA
jgi:hypothetical protein